MIVWLQIKVHVIPPYFIKIKSYQQVILKSRVDVDVYNLKPLLRVVVGSYQISDTHTDVVFPKMNGKLLNIWSTPLK